MMAVGLQIKMIPSPQSSPSVIQTMFGGGHPLSRMTSPPATTVSAPNSRPSSSSSSSSISAILDSPAPSVPSSPAIYLHVPLLATVTDSGPNMMNNNDLPSMPPTPPVTLDETDDLVYHVVEEESTTILSGMNPFRSAPPPTMEETQAIGQQLFTSFCQQTVHQTMRYDPEEVERINELNGDTIPTTLMNTHRVGGYSHPLLRSFGKDLRKIADSFEKSQERNSIIQQADRVDLDSISYDDFTDLMNHLFENGRITRERIVVLFFFCSDVAKRAITKGAGALASKLFTWSCAYVIGTICAWVQAQGGWGVVLGDYLPKLVWTASGVAALVAFCIYIKKNISR